MFKVSKKGTKFDNKLMYELCTHSRSQSVNKSIVFQYNIEWVRALLGNITNQKSDMTRDLNICNETS